MKINMNFNENGKYLQQILEEYILILYKKVIK